MAIKTLIDYSSIHNSKKICVLGNTSGGKSTLSKALSNALNIVLYDLDQFRFGPNWKIIPRDQQEYDEDSVILKESWIIDGIDSFERINNRINHADTVILIDHSIFLHLTWALKRQILFITSPDKVNAPNGCN